MKTTIQTPYFVCLAEELKMNERKSILNINDFATVTYPKLRYVTPERLIRIYVSAWMYAYQSYRRVATTQTNKAY